MAVLDKNIEIVEQVTYGNKGQVNRSFIAQKKKRIKIDEYSNLTIESLREFLDEVMLVGPDWNVQLYGENDDTDDELCLFAVFSRPATKREIEQAEKKRAEARKLGRQREIEILKERIRSLEKDA